VLEPSPRALVLAGAGSGKTRVLVARLAQHIADGVPPDRVVAFSFTRKACAEIAGRLQALMGGRPRFERAPPIAHTFNGFTHRLVIRHHALLGFVRPPRIIVEGERNEVLEAFSHFLDSLESRPPGSARSLLARLRPGPREMPDPGLLWLEDAFRAWRHGEGLIELSDQVPLAIRLLEGPIGEVVRARFDVVLVDEFQDIDLDQQRLFELLLGPRTRYMLFGDDDQAIYRWRGSDPELIRAYHRRPDVVTHLLTTNYRCRAPILAVAGAVIARDAGRVARPAEAHRTGGPRPCVVVGPDQAARVVRTLQRLRSTDRPLEAFAVLVRDHADAGDVARALIREGIPFTRDLDHPGVRLLTFHASKGLEFPVVLLPFLDLGRFPNTRRLARERVALRRRLREAKQAERLVARLERRVHGSSPCPRRFMGLLHRLWHRGTGRTTRRVRSGGAAGYFHRVRLWMRELAERWPGWSPDGPDASSRAESLAKSLEKAREKAIWRPALERALSGEEAEQEASLAEERRLCYVAMTRAQDELWLFCERRAKCSEYLRGEAGRLVDWQDELRRRA
jgi:superfamily I DNA/RNA helicase